MSIIFILNTTFNNIILFAFTSCKWNALIFDSGTTNIAIKVKDKIAIEKNKEIKI